MTAKLIEPGANEGEQREIPITKEEFVIGRGSDCELRLADQAISRHHCMLRQRGRDLTVMDLGSSNGTFINGHRIRSQAPLHNGDELRVGDFRFFVNMDEREGVSWHHDPSVDPAASTLKLNDLKRLRDNPLAENERGHPPGEAGGQGEPGKASG